VRILGIDPGSRFLGYAVVEASDDPARRLRYVECGVITATVKHELARRLAEIATGLGEVIDELAPDVVAVEDVFVRQNFRTALVLGQARGVVLAVAGMAGLHVHSYPPSSVKQAVTGRGRAPKEQVGAMVKALLGLKRPPAVDAADALAVAIAHAHMRGDAPRIRRRA
jgi:crossover junction endodeoxyribonuclease RuvC